MSTDSERSISESLLDELLADESFRPSEPRSLEETSLSPTFIEDLIVKFVVAVGAASGRDIADHVCLPLAILDPLLHSLRSRQILVHKGAAHLGDYIYTLTEQGRTRAQQALSLCGYVGPAPVSLAEYVLSVDAQTIRAESPKREQLQRAFADISINENLFDSLGPAVNSGAGLFLYGDPGNGKTTLARRITSCFGQHIYVPRAVIEDGQLIKLFDSAYHEPVESGANSLIKSGNYDRRWVKVRRPTVIVGGELTLDNLEIRHDPHSNVGEAPIQMKSNCGCLLIDDFGRQRVEPLDLLNRWIVPLENRIDYLTLATGKKIQIPFEQLIIFSTNLEPRDLVDEAFLRRIPYKIEITDPDRDEFFYLFELYADSFRCEYRPDVVDYLLETHYRPTNRALRRCHPRDLLGQIRNLCLYNGYPLEMLPEYFDRVVGSYFTMVNGLGALPPRSAPPEPRAHARHRAAPPAEQQTGQPSPADEAPIPRDSRTVTVDGEPQPRSAAGHPQPAPRCLTEPLPVQGAAAPPVAVPQAAAPPVAAPPNIAPLDDSATPENPVFERHLTEPMLPH